MQGRLARIATGVAGGVLGALLLAACGQKPQAPQADAAPVPAPAPVTTEPAGAVASAVPSEAPAAGSDAGEEHAHDEEHGQDEDHGHAGEAHVHGLAEMAVVIGGDTLTINLISPMYNIAGFEHAPRDAAEQAALEAAQQMLLDAPALFAIDAAAGCELTERVMNYKSFMEGEAGGEDHDHDAEAGHEGSGDDGGLKEVDAEWSFDCADTGRLRSLTVNAFDAFPQLQSVEVVVVAPAGQGAATLTPGSRSVDIPR